MCSAFGSWLVSGLLTGYKVTFLFWSNFDWIRSRGRLWLIVWNFATPQWQLGPVLSCPLQWSVNCQGSRNCSEKSARTYQALALLASFIWTKDVEGLKLWLLGLLDETEIQSTQRNSLNCTGVTCAKHFAFADPSGSVVKEVRLLGFGWVPLRLLDAAFPDTSQFALFGQNDVVTPSNLRHNWKIPVISHRFVFNRHPMLALITLLLEHENIKTSW